MADIQRMGGRFSPPETENGISVLTAAAPVAECADYPREVTAYSRGQGRVSLSLRVAGGVSGAAVQTGGKALNMDKEMAESPRKRGFPPFLRENYKGIFFNEK